MSKERVSPWRSEREPVNTWWSESTPWKGYRDEETGLRCYTRRAGMFYLDIEPSGGSNFWQVVVNSLSGDMLQRRLLYYHGPLKGAKGFAETAAQQMLQSALVALGKHAAKREG